VPRALFAALFAVLAGCATAPAPVVESLPGTRWVATGFDGKTPPTLDFARDRRIAGIGGCNRFFGSVDFTAPATLRFGELGSTRMACHGPEMRDEIRYFHALRLVRSARLEGDALVLLEETGAEVLRFTRAR